MTAQIRLKVLVPLALLGARREPCRMRRVLDSSDRPSPADSHAAAEKIIAQATGVNEAARSGRIDGSILLEVKGFPRFEGPIEITANGVYNLPDGEDVPELDLDVGALAERRRARRRDRRRRRDGLHQARQHRLQAARIRSRSRSSRRRGRRRTG